MYLDKRCAANIKGGLRMSRRAEGARMGATRTGYASSKLRSPPAGSMSNVSRRRTYETHVDDHRRG
jgi:hypothetical protein